MFSNLYSEKPDQKPDTAAKSKRFLKAAQSVDFRKQLEKFRSGSKYYVDFQGGKIQNRALPILSTTPRAYSRPAGNLPLQTPTLQQQRTPMRGGSPMPSYAAN